MTNLPTVDEALTDLSALRAALLAGVSPAALAEHPDAIPAALVPANMTVTDLEHLLPAPTRKRCTVRTNSLSDFLAYCAHSLRGGYTAFDHGNPYVFVEEAPNIQALAVLDFGTPAEPGWGLHRALWTPTDSPPMQALRRLLGKALTQEALTDYIDDWGDFLAFERADGTPVPTAAARGAIADMTAETVRAMRSKTGDFERERSALEKLTVSPTVPARMVLTCAPWAGFAARPLQVRISASESSSTIALRLALVAWGLHEAALLEELHARLAESGTQMTVIQGVLVDGD